MTGSVSPTEFNEHGNDSQDIDHFDDHNHIVLANNVDQYESDGDNNEDEDSGFGYDANAAVQRVRQNSQADAFKVYNAAIPKTVGTNDNSKRSTYTNIKKAYYVSGGGNRALFLIGFPIFLGAAIGGTVGFFLGGPPGALAGVIQGGLFTAKYISASIVAGFCLVGGAGSVAVQYRRRMEKKTLKGVHDACTAIEKGISVGQEGFIRLAAAAHHVCRRILSVRHVVCVVKDCVRDKTPEHSFWDAYKKRVYERYEKNTTIINKVWENASLYRTNSYTQSLTDSSECSRYYYSMTGLMYATFYAATGYTPTFKLNALNTVNNENNAESNIDLPEEIVDTSARTSNNVVQSLRTDFARDDSAVTIICDGQELAVTALDKDKQVIQYKKNIESLQEISTALSEHVEDKNQTCQQCLENTQNAAVKRALLSFLIRSGSCTQTVGQCIDVLQTEIQKTMKNFNAFLQDKPGVLSHKIKWLQKELDCISALLQTPRDCEDLSTRQQEILTALATLQQSEETITTELNKKHITLDDTFSYQHEIAYNLTKDLNAQQSLSRLSGILLSRYGTKSLQNKIELNSLKIEQVGPVTIDVKQDGSVQHTYALDVIDLNRKLIARYNSTDIVQDGNVQITLKKEENFVDEWCQRYRNCYFNYVLGAANINDIITEQITQSAWNVTHVEAVENILCLAHGRDNARGEQCAASQAYNAIVQCVKCSRPEEILSVFQKIVQIEQFLQQVGPLAGSKIAKMLYENLKNQQQMITKDTVVDSFLTSFQAIITQHEGTVRHDGSFLQQAHDVQFSLMVAQFVKQHPLLQAQADKSLKEQTYNENSDPMDRCVTFLENVIREAINDNDTKENLLLHSKYYIGCARLGMNMMPPLLLLNRQDVSINDRQNIVKDLYLPTIKQLQKSTLSQVQKLQAWLKICNTTVGENDTYEIYKNNFNVKKKEVFRQLTDAALKTIANNIEILSNNTMSQDETS